MLKALPGLPSAIFAVPILATASRGGGGTIGLVVGVLALLVVTGLVAGWLRWRMFTYEILPDQLVISKGVLHRTRRSIPSERIQDVSIKQGLLARLFGLAEVRIETGGGEKDEGRLDSVSLAEAHRLRALLRAVSQGETLSSADRFVEPELDEPVLYRLTFGRLLVFGLFNFSLVWIAALAGAAQYLGQAFDFGWARWLAILGLAEQDLLARLSVGVVIGGIALGLALGLVAGVIRTVVRFHGFRLSFVEGRFRYSRGLLTRTEVAVAQRQIQIGLVEKGVLSGRLGWCAFNVQTLGGTDEVSGRQALAPFARPSEIAPLVDLAGQPAFDPSGLRSVSSWQTEAGLLGFVALPAAVLVGVAVLVAPVALLLPGLAVPLAVALLRRDRHRFALGETSLFVTRGVLRHRKWTVPYRNIQSAILVQDPIQRLRGVASVRVDTAGGGGFAQPHIHDLETAEARVLIHTVVARVEASHIG